MLPKIKDRKGTLYVKGNLFAKLSFSNSDQRLLFSIGIPVAYFSIPSIGKLNWIKKKKNIATTKDNSFVLKKSFLYFEADNNYSHFCYLCMGEDIEFMESNYQ